VGRERGRRRRKVVFALAATLSVSVGGVMLARSSLFALEGIDVVGTRMLTPAEVIQASGLRPGQNMLAIHTDRVRARIASLPLVRSVGIRKASSRIRIQIVERSPAFVLETTDGRWNLDAYGVVLDPATGTIPSLPVVQVDSSVHAGTGDRVRNPSVLEALRLWSRLPSTLRRGPVTIDASTPAGLSVDQGGGMIRFGTTDRLDEKIEAVELVLERIRRTGAVLVSLDVRAPSRPAARLA